MGGLEGREGREAEAEFDLQLHARPDMGIVGRHDGCFAAAAAGAGSNAVADTVETPDVGVLQRLVTRQLLSNEHLEVSSDALHLVSHFGYVDALV